MNMNKALQNLYHAVSNETTTKVNISKLLVDIHYAITGKESPNKNNWSKIINSMADNWPEGGGGSSDFSTAEVTIVNNLGMPIAVFGAIATEEDDEFFTINNWSVLYSDRIQVVMYKGLAYGGLDGPFSTVNTTGDISWNGDTLTITGDGTITIS